MSWEGNGAFFLVLIDSILKKRPAWTESVLGRNQTEAFLLLYPTSHRSLSSYQKSPSISPVPSAKQIQQRMKKFCSLLRDLVCMPNRL
jgi:hypothetical protein